MVVVTAVIQPSFTVVGIRALRRRVSEEIIRFPLAFDRDPRCIWALVVLATVLQMWTWALHYLLLDAIEPLEKAIYFSVERLRQSVMATWSSMITGGYYHHSSQQMKSEHAPAGNLRPYRLPLWLGASNKFLRLQKTANCLGAFN